MWCSKLKCHFSAIFSLFGALSTHILIEGLSNAPAFVHFLSTAYATHSNLQIMALFLVLFNYVLFPTLVLPHQFMVLTFLAVFLVHIQGLFLSQQKVAEQPKRTASIGVMRFFSGIMLAMLARLASRE